jgi:CheY-like chemotaxis protein
MTANARPQDVQECLDAGMDGVLTKPVPVDELRSVLEAAAQKRASVEPTLRTRML